MSSLDEERCSICLSDLQCPRVLPCSHSFCHQCLQQHIHQSHNTIALDFRCPLCRRRHRPTNPRYPLTLWASSFPINIFARLKCANHNVSVDGICFCHDAPVCFHCLMKVHRTCCLSINPARKSEIVSYFGELSQKALVWQKRLIDLEGKKERNVESASSLTYIDQTLVYLENFLHSLEVDIETINQQTRDSDTIQLTSYDFEILENTVASNVRPHPYCEFDVRKQDRTKSRNPLLLQKLLSDDKMVGGFSGQSKVYVASLEGEYLCEVLLMGELISLDTFDDYQIILLLKAKASTVTEGGCLQHLRYSGEQIISLNFYYPVRNYVQIGALSEGNLIALYYEYHWIIDVLHIKEPNIITVDNYILNTNVRPQIYPFDSQYVIYTNEIEVFRVNLKDKTELCLLSKSRAQRNFIERISCLTAMFSAIFFADIEKGVVYKMNSHGTLITIFLKEEVGAGKISSFHFNTRRDILTCFDGPQDYVYRLYNGEDFSWAEDF